MLHQQQSQVQKRILKFSIMQIQPLNLLQLSSQQIEVKIQSELEENPALEEGADEEEDIDQANDSEDLSLSAEDTGVDEPVKEIEDDFNIEDYMDEEYIPQY